MVDTQTVASNVLNISLGTIIFYEFGKAVVRDCRERARKRRRVLRFWRARRAAVNAKIRSEIAVHKRVEELRAEVA